MSEDSQTPTNNGAVLTISLIICAVISSAAEAELGALYINSREAVPMQMNLQEMGHKQPKTPIHIDNNTAFGVIANSIQPKQTKAMDMRFHCLWDREAQKQFQFY